MRVDFHTHSNASDGTLSPTELAEAGMKAGLVVLREEGSAVVRLGFRATREPAELLAAPLFYTEVRFQGQTDVRSESEGAGK